MARAWSAIECEFVLLVCYIGCVYIGLWFTWKSDRFTSHLFDERSEFDRDLWRLVYILLTALPLSIGKLYGYVFEMDIFFIQCWSIRASSPLDFKSIMYYAKSHINLNLQSNYDPIHATPKTQIMCQSLTFAIASQNTCFGRYTNMSSTKVWRMRYSSALRGALNLTNCVLPFCLSYNSVI